MVIWSKSLSLPGFTWDASCLYDTPCSPALPPSWPLLVSRSRHSACQWQSWWWWWRPWLSAPSHPSPPQPDLASASVEPAWNITLGVAEISPMPLTCYWSSQSWFCGTPASQLSARRSSSQRLHGSPRAAPRSPRIGCCRTHPWYLPFPSYFLASTRFFFSQLFSFSSFSVFLLLSKIYRFLFHIYFSFSLAKYPTPFSPPPQKITWKSGHRCASLTCIMWLNCITWYNLYHS